MTLPVKFKNVHYYRIAGHYIFAGDLFVTRGSLYFFPEIDLEEQRKELSSHVSSELALLVQLFTWLGQRVGSYSSRTEFWQDGITHEQFQNEAAAYIYKMKLERQDKAFLATLPLPTHVRTDEISGMKLKPNGVLSFSAQSDTHDFNIGLWRKKRLQDALWEAGLSCGPRVV